MESNPDYPTMCFLNNMGHQELNLLYVWKELILYYSPNCVYSIMQTQVTAMYWECHLTLCPNKLNKYHPQNLMTCLKIKIQQNFDDVTGHIGQVTIGSNNRALFASPGIWRSLYWGTPPKFILSQCAWWSRQNTTTCPRG